MARKPTEKKKPGEEAGVVRKLLEQVEKKLSKDVEKASVGDYMDCTPKMRHEVKGPPTLNGEVYGIGQENVQP